MGGQDGVRALVGDVFREGGLMAQFEEHADGQMFFSETLNARKKMTIGEAESKKILDMTCGSRTIWFNKNHPAVVYCDKRREDSELYFGKARTSLRQCHVNPDIQCDFTDLPFADNTFSLVVFDPPHLLNANNTAWLVKKYGKLDEKWPEMIRDGFKEGMRVLKPDGVLIFKWSEYDIPAEKVWRAIGQKPLFGHHSGKKSTTFWGVFMKGVVT